MACLCCYLLSARHRSDILGKADSADNLSDVPNSVSPLNSHEPHSVKDEDGMFVCVCVCVGGGGGGGGEGVW